MISREGLMRLGLAVFLVSVLFGIKQYFLTGSLEADSRSERLRGDLGMAYATCVAENDLPGDYRSTSTLKTLAELNPKERAVVLGCAAEYQSLDLARWVLSDKSLPVTVNPDFRGRWPVEKIAGWGNGKDAAEALELIFESEGKNLFFSPFTAQEQSVVAAYNTTTPEAARFFAEKWPDLINKESDRLSTLDKYSPDFSNLTLAQYHALKGRFDVAQSFAEHGSKVAKAQKSLRHEIFLKQRELLLDDRLDQFLLAHAVSIDERDETNKTLLHNAVEQNDVKLVDHLLGQNARTDAQDTSGATPLHYAASKGSPAVISLLLTKATPNTQNYLGRTPLHEAFSAGFWDAANLLLDKGALMGIRDNLGRTPIFDCVQHGCPILDRAITSGADINAIDKEGNSLLHVLDQPSAGNAEMIDKLIARGCQAGRTNKAGRTPLHQIVVASDIAAAAALLAKGSDPNQRDLMGNTALHLATTAEMVSALLEAGANPDLSNKSGDIPLNHGIGRTQMLFHSPSHIEAKTDTLIRYFSDIQVGEQQIEIMMPTRGAYTLNQDDDPATASRTLMLLARQPNQEYRVEEACQMIVNPSIAGNSATPQPIIVSDWKALQQTGPQTGVFTMQDWAGNCNASNPSSDSYIETLLEEGKGDSAKLEAIAKQCRNAGTDNCIELVAPILRVTVRNGEEWKEAGVIMASPQLNAMSN